TARRDLSRFVKSSALLHARHLLPVTPSGSFTRLGGESWCPRLQCVCKTFSLLPLRIRSIWFSERLPHVKFEARLSLGLSLRCLAHSCSPRSPTKASRTMWWT